MIKRDLINDWLIPALLFIIVLAGLMTWIYFDTKDKYYVIKNNSTRDYIYEHYCDSIYEVNPDYYEDVLVESDKFQDYINEHGEWWTN